MKRYLFSCAALLTTTIAVSPASADLHNCNGVWMDRPCNQAAQPPAAAPAAAVVSAAPQENEQSKQAQRDLSRKRSLIHDLTMKSIRARDEYELTLGTAAVEEHCLDAATSVLDCQKEVEAAHERFDKRVTEAALVKEQLRANKLKEETNRIDAQRRASDNNQTVVVINEGRRYPYRDPYYPGYGTYPGQHRRDQSYGSANIGVSVGGSSGNTRIGISGNVGSSSTTYQNETRYLGPTPVGPQPAPRIQSPVTQSPGPQSSGIQSAPRPQPAPKNPPTTGGSFGAKRDSRR